MAEIMCTLSGAQIADGELLRRLCEAGMTAVRINTAHLDSAEELAAMARRLKSACRPLKVLIDTKGPEMRTTAMAGGGEIVLSDGETVVVEGSDADECTRPGHIVVNYADLHTAVEPGDRMLIDDGRIELTVTSVDGHTISTRVSHGGTLGSRKGLSIAGKNPPLAAVGAHDLEYIQFAAGACDIDLIAHSFVRSAADVLAVKEAMGQADKPVIAKIENPQGIDNLEEIAAVADGILIARGDLTATIGAEAVPAAQAKIAEVARKHGLPIYLATNILPSMMTDREPSADDLTRIATAVSEGVDTFLLTNETASGIYPVECVRVLKREIT